MYKRYIVFTHDPSRKARPVSLLLVVVVLGLVLIATGCSQHRLRSSEMPLDDPAALQAMTPEDAEQAADFLAVAADGYYFADQYAEAEAAADQALERVPDHGGAMYVKGLLDENAGQWAAARDIYRRSASYAQMDDELERRMQSRFAIASREVLREEVDGMVAGPDLALAPNALVVHRLQPVGNTRADTVLANGVTDFLTTSFAMVEELTVIDRTRRVLLEEEIARSQNAAYDPSTRLMENKVGAGLAFTGAIGTAPSDDKAAEARFMVNDLVAAPGSAEYRGTDGQLELSTSKRHLLQDVGKQVVEICESYLGLSLDQELKERLARPPTSSYKAFLAYSEGLQLEDEGRYPEAYSQYNLATQHDSGFTRAQAGADRVGGAGAGGSAMSMGDDLPPSPSDFDMSEEVLDTAIVQADDIPVDRTQEPNQEIIVHTTVRIEIITHQR